MTAPGPSEPQDAPRFVFHRGQRVLRKADFGRAMKVGIRLIDDRVVCWCALSGLPHARLGLVVGRRYGSAPRRNRAKRLTREAFRHVQHELPPGIDFVVSPRIGVKLALADLETSFRRLATRASRRLHSPDA